MADAPTEAPERNRRRLFWPGGLSARLLVLTVVFAALGGAMAQGAVDCLIRHIRRRPDSAGEGPESQRLDYELVIRQSVAGPA